MPKQWNGVLLTSLAVVLTMARRRTWKGKTPAAPHLSGAYANSITVANDAMAPINERLSRAATLPKYDVIITPQSRPGR